MKALSRSVLMLAFAVLGIALAHAQFYPSTPVQVVVAYPAGGAADLIVRGLASRLTRQWGQQIVIENRGGGGTQIATELVGKSAPNGHTLLATGMETFAISPFLYSKLSYDPKDFVPVSGLTYSNQMLVVPAASSFKSVQDVLAKARQEQGALQYGTIGIGGSSHINMVYLETLTNTKLTAVHYRGGAPMLNDLLGDHIPMGFLSIALVSQAIQQGKLRALAVGSANRLEQFPDVPTIAESGVPGFEAVSWFGLFAPAATPGDVVKRINADVQAEFVNREFRDKFLAPSSLEVIPGDPKEFSAYIDAEAAKWRDVIKAAKLKVE
jgi:tripartite-type tricarboxylate transporter receptor subunit TctC